MDMADYQEAAYLVCAAPILFLLACTIALAVLLGIERVIVKSLRSTPDIPAVIERSDWNVNF